MEKLIEATGITKAYGALTVLKGVDLTVNKGEVVSIVGASGAGKTTLLQIVGTLDKPDKGKLLINNTDVFALGDKKLSAFRNQNIGFVFQFHHLLPEFTALENVCIPAFIAKTGKKEAEERAKELLSMLGLSQRINHKPSELSGGEQQRVAVARALVNNPAVVLADEPSGNLDSANAKDLHQLFFTLREKLNQTFIIVTHNDELAGMADRKIVMRDGLMV
jgi:lipoprotein-releasing system ATP-binding protein